MMKNKYPTDVYVSSNPEPEEEDAAQTYRVSSASASGNDEASEDEEEQYDEGGLVGIGTELQNSFDNNTTTSMPMQTSDQEFAERSLPEDIYKMNGKNTNSLSSIPDGEDATKSSCDPSSCSAGSGSSSGSADGEGDGDKEDQYDEELLQNSFDLEFAERSLPEDTFSFLIYCCISSRSFVLGIVVFLFQIGIYIILTANIVKQNESNRFGFPGEVSVPLRISEFLAILISIITQTDVRKAICLYRDGFDETGLTQVFQGARFWKWALSIGLRASEGLLGLIIAFLLIMRSDDVLELLLNFSAIEFVTILDDVVFELAREGFFGREMKKEAKRLIRKTYFVSKDCANSKSASRLSILYFVVLFLSFFGGLTTIALKQNRGFYFCDVISSQFSDEVFSVPSQGFYRRQNTTDGRITYRLHFDEHSGQELDKLLFAYCEIEQRWTLSIDDTSTTEWDPCNSWVAASSKSESGDSRSLFESTSFPWLIKDQTKMTGSRVTAHFLECYEEINRNMLMIPAPIITLPTTPTITPTSNLTTTNAPTSSPARSPTNHTKQPRSTPSNKPTAQPSPLPSSNPTKQLSSSPSNKLTADPTLLPSTQPSSRNSRWPGTKASKST